MLKRVETGQLKACSSVYNDLVDTLIYFKVYAV